MENTTSVSQLETVIVAKASKELEDSVAEELNIPDPDEKDEDDTDLCTKLKD